MLISHHEFELILSDNYQKIINENLKTEISALALKIKSTDLPTRLIIDQIASKQKAFKKNLNWYNTSKIFYPPPLSLEQSSSDITALHKSKLVSGNTLVDLTGGMGVDSFAFSKTFKKVYYLEKEPLLCKIAEHNFNQLGANNIEVINCESEVFLDKMNFSADCIYLDPARRNVNLNKVFKFSDCAPNVIDLLPYLKCKGSSILIKSSPLLDLTQSIQELQEVSVIEIVADNNDCKELLFLIKPEKDINISINCHNLNTNQPSFNIWYEFETKELPEYDLPKNYLYEPNSAILKSGGFNQVATKFKLFKLHVNSHLYSSNELVENFPGRVFSVLNICKYNQKEISNVIKTKQANITARNFPYTVAEIRKKLKLTDGGNTYLFATTLIDDSLKVLVCQKNHKA